MRSKPCGRSAAGHTGGMRRAVVVGLGFLLMLVGAVWTLQGVGILRGSAMSGDVRWAVLGPIVALSGVVLLERTRQHHQ
jgi:hypothetical protein